MPDGSSRDAEIIAVGSEMLTPQRLDTNSLFITDQLNALGVEVRRKVIVGDDRAILAEAVQNALAHADVVIVTGGLGPTEDDVTREAVAQALGRPLALRQDLLEAIEERFRRRQRRMADNNKKQAYVVEGAEALPNPNGTAAGQWIREGSQVVMMLPGPPGELKPMFADQCAPRLAALLPPQSIRARLYRVTGMTESDLDHLIAPVYTKYSNPMTTILASPFDIQIHLRARSGTEAEAEGRLAELGGAIEALLGDRIFSRNGDSLEAVVGELLRARGATVAVAESCTGGMLAERITSVPGSSDYFAGGFIVYSNEMKQRTLGVDAELIARYSAVSEEVAGAMAEGARERSGATYAISTTGEAGPESSTGAPVGTVYVGFAGLNGATEAKRFNLPGDRTRVRMFATQGALDFLRRKILN
jgi:nicotinamide-nucleotide amidase